MSENRNHEVGRTPAYGSTTCKRARRRATLTLSDRDLRCSETDLEALRDAFRDSRCVKRFGAWWVMVGGESRGVTATLELEEVPGGKLPGDPFRLCGGQFEVSKEGVDGRLGRVIVHGFDLDPEEARVALSLPVKVGTGVFVVMDWWITRAAETRILHADVAEYLGPPPGKLLVFARGEFRDSRGVRGREDEKSPQAASGEAEGGGEGQSEPPDIAPPPVRARDEGAAEYLRANLPAEAVGVFKKAMLDHGERWWLHAGGGGWHLAGGMAVRNLLRHGGYVDELFGGNLDDHYVRLVELALGREDLEVGRRLRAVGAETGCEDVRTES